MEEPATAYTGSSNSGNSPGESAPARSYVAMLLSAISAGTRSTLLGTISEGIYPFFNICFSIRHFLSQFNASKGMA